MPGIKELHWTTKTRMWHPEIPMDDPPVLSLVDRCFETIRMEPEMVFKKTSTGFAFPDNYVLPQIVAEEYLTSFPSNSIRSSDEITRVFMDRKKAIIKNVYVWDSEVTEMGISNLIMNQDLKRFTIGYCPRVTANLITVVNRNCAALESFAFGIGTPIGETFRVVEPRPLNAPNLKRLNICHMDIENKLFFAAQFKLLPNLTYLELMCCGKLGQETYAGLKSLKKLVGLSLYAAHDIFTFISYIFELTSLRHLDISQFEEEFGVSQVPNATLAKIVEKLPNLESLDISGTNLVGTGATDPTFFNEEKHCDIPGLTERVGKPLKFLGLYMTRAGSRRDIPATIIAGDSSEAQLLVSAKVYMRRAPTMQRILNEVFHWLRRAPFHNVGKLLLVILEAMTVHLRNKGVQISGSAALFYVVRENEYSSVVTAKKRRIINALINAMAAHRRDETLMRNASLTLCQFKIPDDIIFIYQRLVVLLLDVTTSVLDAESFVQRIGIYLLNSLACQVNDKQKVVLGDLGLVENMVVLISNRVSRKVCDDVLEVAWSTMWNVTDETPINCQRFIEAHGLRHLKSCVSLFAHRMELMRNMMGLIGNVAEVPELRKYLMEHVKLFGDLMNSTTDGIEVAYNAAGVVAHLASDGPSAWTAMEDRTGMLRAMVHAVKQWPITCDRNINYRSFEPILKLASIFDTPECQYWALWALANLTTVHPAKYVPILEKEGGLKILNQIINSRTSNADLKELASVTLKNCQENVEPTGEPTQADGISLSAVIVPGE